MVAFQPSCTPGSSNDFLILWTVLKIVRSPELGSSRSLKLAPLKVPLMGSLPCHDEYCMNIAWSLNSTPLKNVMQIFSLLISFHSCNIWKQRSIYKELLWVILFQNSSGFCNILKFCWIDYLPSPISYLIFKAAVLYQWPKWGVIEYVTVFWLKCKFKNLIETKLYLSFSSG